MNPYVSFALVHNPRCLAILPIIEAFPEGGTELRRAIPDKRGEGEEEGEEVVVDEDANSLSFSRSASTCTTSPPKLCPTTMGGLFPASTSFFATLATSSA